MPCLGTPGWHSTVSIRLLVSAQVTISRPDMEPRGQSQGEPQGRLHTQCRVYLRLSPSFSVPPPNSLSLKYMNKS